jgi:hypothetical protein
MNSLKIYPNFVSAFQIWDPRSGIRDKHPGSATLLEFFFFLFLSIPGTGQPRRPEAPAPPGTDGRCPACAHAQSNPDR